MKIPSPTRFLWIILAALICSSACTWNSSPKGSEKNPITISLVPSKETSSLLHDAEDFSRWMEKETGWKFKVTIPTSYVAVVEAMGSQRVDIAYLNTTTYFLAKEKYGAEVKFISVNAEGTTVYKGQFITRADSGVKKLQDLNGKRIAYVDPTSASGYILAASKLKKLGIQPSRSVFAGRHDAVVTMVYQKQVDAGATFHAAPENGKPMDARRLVVSQYPDVWEKIKILDYTESLANDAIVFRRELDEPIKEKLTQAMAKWAASPEGRVTLKGLNNANGLKPVTEKDYEESQRILKEMSQSLNQ